MDEHAKEKHAFDGNMGRADQDVDRVYIYRYWDHLGRPWYSLNMVI